VVVVLVGLEVLGKVFDSLRENRNLNLGRTGVTVVRCVLFDDVVLDSKIKWHVFSPFGSLRGATPGW
jgi:hypothetical protein